MIPHRPSNSRICGMVSSSELMICMRIPWAEDLKVNTLPRNGDHRGLCPSPPASLDIHLWPGGFLPFKLLVSSFHFDSMFSFDYALVVLATVSQVAAIPHVSHVRGGSYAPAKRYSGLVSDYIYNQARADAVKQTFQISWDGYYTYAFPGDSLLPVTNTFENDR